ncbi:MAG TPA: ribonuclease D [Hellea balneolensis]|uniref:Ribonuclease D n=1 Tax=Hellea balneolensis TaxID=287478 RepID=A0A7C5R7I4_9PROT|nr:ribonuclease D [Hellea balneolensis]
MKIITDTDSLHKFCQKASSAPFIAVDTEFMRERTFYSILALIQIATPDDEAIIDPLAKGLDMTPFLELLLDEKITKVLHSSRQDYEIFYQMCGEVPKPLFDTQIAAMALGYGESIGYLALVKGELGIKLDKGQRFTDWMKRPLSDKQLSYALADVTHLRDLYPGLVRKLKQKGRTDLVKEEMQALYDETLYNFDPDLVWRRLKPKSRHTAYLAVMKAVAAWREKQAKARNIPRNRVFKDDVIYQIAQRRPRSLKDLSALRGIPPGLHKQKNVDRLIKAIGHACDNADKLAPVIPKPVNMPAGLGPATEMLKTLLRIRAENEGIAPRIVASNAELEKIAAFGEDADVKTLKGWRRKLFGEEALKMREGKLSLRLIGKDVVVEAVKS